MIARIRYRTGYKYQLAEDHSEWLHLGRLLQDYQGDFLELDIGISPQDPTRLTMLKGYAWDGPSGPAVDSPNFMRGSLVHDALYQLLRLGVLPQFCRKRADEELRRICLEDGMPRIRAELVYWAVRTFARRPALVTSVRPVLTAP